MKERYTIVRLHAARPGDDPFLGPRPPDPSLESVSKGLRQVRVDEDELSKNDAQRLASEPGVGVLLTMPIKLVRPRSTAAGEDAHDAADDGWGLRAIKADESTFDGRGVVVAVLDTGVDPKHPAFEGVALERRNFGHGHDDDVDGHGTHCAGTVFGRDVGGTRIGVARGVEKALIGKVLDDDGNGASTAIYEGLLWALDRGAHVVSLSVGIDFPGMVRQYVDRGLPDDIAAARALRAFASNLRAFDRLLGALARPNPEFGRRMGCVVVGAAGNESRRQVNAAYEVSAALPSAAEDAISVGALDRSPDGLTVPAYSNTMPTFCAPGERIVSALRGGGLTTLGGTSMAAPHVAGVAALWWQERREAFDNATSAHVVAMLTATARRGEVFALGVDPADLGLGLVTAPS